MLCGLGLAGREPAWERDAQGRTLRAVCCQGPGTGSRARGRQLGQSWRNGGSRPSLGPSQASPLPRIQSVCPFSMARGHGRKPPWAPAGTCTCHQREQRDAQRENPNCSQAGAQL
uniref:Uncharacterized protein n=1 Tax=Prolemur simus TaxID=1328070 RepID=A0A8C8YIB8_PROSS